MNSRVLIVSAETSSCEYIESLLMLWKEREVRVDAFGVGNQRMADLGFELIGSSDEMAFFGSLGAIGKYKKLKAIFDKILEACDQNRPACALLLDYSGFNLRLAKELKERGIPVVYYVSPQVWAWDRGRTEKIRAFVDRMLVLFPFEVDYYKKHGIEAEFVGHPALEKLDPIFLDEKHRKIERARFGVGPEDKLIGFMPGSRMGEVEKHLPVMMEVARRLHKSSPHMKFAFLTSPNFTKEQLSERLTDLRLSYVILKDEPFKMLQLVDDVLVASGTATLMVALLEKPMTVMYKASWITGALAKRFIQVPFICIVNLLAGKELVPERVLKEANPQVLTELMLKLDQDTEYRQNMITGLREIRAQLGAKEGATPRVAQVIEEYFG